MISTSVTARFFHYPYYIFECSNLFFGDGGSKRHFFIERCENSWKTIYGIKIDEKCLIGSVSANSSRKVPFWRLYRPSKIFHMYHKLTLMPIFWVINICRDSKIFLPSSKLFLFHRVSISHFSIWWINRKWSSYYLLEVHIFAYWYFRQIHAKLPLDFQKIEIPSK